MQISFRIQKPAQRVPKVKIKTEFGAHNGLISLEFLNYREAGIGRKADAVERKDTTRVINSAPNERID
jgi:hypothetical protein